MDIFWFLWQMLVSAVETILACYLFTKRIGNHKDRLKPLVGAVVVFTALLLTGLFRVPDMTAACIRFALYIGYAYLAFGKSRIVRIVWGCIPALVTVIANALAFGIASALNYGDLAGAWMWGSVHFYVSATAVMLQVILVLIAANAGKQDTYQYSLSPVRLAFLVAMSMIAIVAINLQMGVVYTLTGIIGTQATQQSAVFVSLCVVAVSVALVWLVCSLGKESQKTMEKSLEIRQAQLENSYYRSLEISVEGLRGLRHDISTHIHVMKSLIEKGSNEELKNYFNSIERQYQADNAVFVTDNTMLNAVLTSKRMTAREYHIEMEVSYTTKRTIPLSPTDFCSLTGNMIDNGIEACQKVMDENKRYIDISIGDKGDMVYIKVKNCSDGIYSTVDGELRTTKAGGRHGIGLARIRKIAESAGGFFDVNPRPDEFTAVVMLPSAVRGRDNA